MNLYESKRVVCPGLLGISEIKLNRKLPSTANRTKPPTKFSPPQRSNLYQAPPLCSAPYKEMSLCSTLVELSLFVTCGMLILSGQQTRFIGKQPLLWECGRRLSHCFAHLWHLILKKGRYLTS